MILLRWFRRQLREFLFWGLTWGLVAMIVIPVVVKRRARRLIQKLEPEEPDDGDRSST